MRGEALARQNVTFPFKGIRQTSVGPWISAGPSMTERPLVLLWRGWVDARIGGINPALLIEMGVVLPEHAPVLIRGKAGAKPVQSRSRTGFAAGLQRA